MTRRKALVLLSVTMIVWSVMVTAAVRASEPHMSALILTAAPTGWATLFFGHMWWRTYHRRHPFILPDRRDR